MSTRLLIDGYNLLFASGVFASSAGPPTLQRTREALLQFLADSLDPKLLGRTIVVFDATQAPPGLPRELSFAGMRVLFSRGGQEADDLLEDLIAAQRAPRELLVVSSDHRLQRAARQRGAAFIDSERWLRDLQRRPAAPLDRDLPDDSLNSSAELQKWLSEFADVDPQRLAPLDPPPKPALPKPPAPATPDPIPIKPKQEKRRRQKKSDDDEKPSSGAWNPFPPGYGEDLLGPQDRK